MAVSAQDWLSGIQGVPGFSGNMDTPLDFYQGQSPSQLFGALSYNDSSGQRMMPDPLKGDLTEGLKIAAIFAAAMAGGAGMGALGAEAGMGAGAGFSGGGGLDAAIAGAGDAGAGASLGTAGTAAGAGAGSGGSWSSGIQDWFKGLSNPFSSGAGWGENMAAGSLAGDSGAVGAAAAQGAGSTSSFFGNMGPLDWMRGVSGGMNILNSFRGLSGAKNIAQIGQDQSNAMNPFGPERSGYATDLRNLMNDPSSITKRPGFDAGRLALDRGLAGQGYNPATAKIPGNYMSAMSKYGGDFYNQEVQRLMQMSGANFAPTGGNLALQGAIGANDARGNAYASMGYGATQLLPLLMGLGSGRG